MAALIAERVGDAELHDARVKLDLPVMVENGNSVGMTMNRHPTAIRNTGWRGKAWVRSSAVSATAWWACAPSRSRTMRWTSWSWSCTLVRGRTVWRWKRRRFGHDGTKDSTMTATGGAATRPLLFTPITLRGITARNSVLVSPMCQFTSRSRAARPTGSLCISVAMRWVAPASCSARKPRSRPAAARPITVPASGTVIRRAPIAASPTSSRRWVRPAIQLGLRPQRRFARRDGRLADALRSGSRACGLATG